MRHSTEHVMIALTTAINQMQQALITSNAEVLALSGG